MKKKFIIFILVLSLALSISGTGFCADLDGLKDNYIKDIKSNGKIAKWNKNYLNVYIPDVEGRKKVLYAFKEWEKATNGLVKFKFVSSPRKYDIRVNFVSELSDNLAAATKTYYIGNILIKADIFLLEKKQKDNLRCLALHEIGHALGIIGHSKNENDIMAQHGLNKDSHLSERDINTLLYIYYNFDDSAVPAAQD